MWISKTPLRVSFFGGGTDYPSYFSSRKGAVLGSTINKYIYIFAIPLVPFADQKFRVTYRSVESAMSIDEIRHPVIKSCLRYFNYDEPLNLATFSDLPGGTGLGSSSAFTVGFVNLLHMLRGQTLTRYELARQAIFVEQELLHENVGVQDQIHASFGGLSRYEFYGKDFSIHPVRITTERLEILNKHLLLVYTGKLRHASSVLTEQEKRTQSGINEDQLSVMYEMVAEGVRILEAANDDNFIASFGALLNEAWHAKKNLSSLISNSTIDIIYKEGLNLGALGGKVCGAGSGGFMLFLAPPATHHLFQAHFGHGNVCSVRLETRGAVASDASQ
jgi:D-glycero-alpha-D-manno-heptose-7-phosphate kinase